VTLVFGAHGLLFGTWVSRIPAFQDDLSLGEAELGLALLGATLGGFLALPLSGWIVSRSGSRAMVSGGLAAFALLLVLLPLSPTLPALALALFAFGAAGGALDIAMNAQGLALERGYGRPILSSFHAAWSFGGLAGAGLGALAAALDVEPLAHFAALALLLGPAALATSRWLVHEEDGRSAERPRLRRPPRRLLSLGLLAFCGLFAEGVAADWSAVYLAGPLDSGAATAALGFAAFSVSMACFRLTGDPLTVRWGPVALLRWGGALAGGALGLALLIGHPAAALVAFACMGAGLAAIVPIVFRAAGSLPGIPAGVGIAALTTVGYSAFLIGPPAIGFTAEAVGLPLALGLVVALLGLLTVLAPTVQQPRRVV